MKAIQPDHERIEELIAVRALGGLDAPEVAELDRLRVEHGTGCETCALLEADYGEVAGRLAFAATPADVPAGFEDQVVAAAVAQRPTNVRRVSFGMRRLLAASAAAVLLVAGGVGGYLLRSPGSPGLDLQGARVTSLQGSGQGTVSLAFLPKTSQWYLIGSNLAAVPTGKVYELWLFHGKTPAPAGTFTPRNGVALLKVGSDASTANLAAITIENAPGAQQPTTQPIFSGSV